MGVTHMANSRLCLHYACYPELLVQMDSDTASVIGDTPSGKKRRVSSNKTKQLAEALAEQHRKREEQELFAW
eukprot:2904839-Lingulodinium_polyedra.AAC.1